MAATAPTPAEIAALNADPRVAQHERSLYASLWVPFFFTVIAMSLRFWARILRRSLGPDDWTMLFGWILYTIGVCLSTALVARGSLKHIATIDPTDLVWILKVSDITQIFGSWAATISKTAVGLLIPRLMTGTSSKWRNYFIYGNIVIYICTTIVTSFLIFFQCSPPRANWETQLIVEGKAKCSLTPINTDMTIFQSSFGIWMDFMLALIPTTFVYKLRVPIKQKLAICIVLGLGIVAGCVAIVKTIQFTNGFASSDPTFNTYALFLWGGLELPFIVIAGSAAPAKPIFDKFFSGKPIREGPSVGAVYASDNSKISSRRKWFSLASSSKTSSTRSLQTEKTQTQTQTTPQMSSRLSHVSDIEAQRHESTAPSDQIMVNHTVSVEHDAVSQISNNDRV